MEERAGGGREGWWEGEKGLAKAGHRSQMQSITVDVEAVNGVHQGNHIASPQNMLLRVIAINALLFQEKSQHPNRDGAARRFCLPPVLLRAHLSFKDSNWCFHKCPPSPSPRSAPLPLPTSSDLTWAFTSFCDAPAHLKLKLINMHAFSPVNRSVDTFNSQVPKPLNLRG